MFHSFLLPVNSMSIATPGINSQLSHFSPKAKDQINSYRCEHKKIACLSFCGSTRPLDPSKERLLAFIHLSIPVPKVPAINNTLNLSSLCKFLLFFRTNPFNLVRPFPLLRKFQQELPWESCPAACSAYAIHWRQSALHFTSFSNFHSSWPAPSPIFPSKMLNAAERFVPGWSGGNWLEETFLLDRRTYSLV